MNLSLPELKMVLASMDLAIKYSIESGAATDDLNFLKTMHNKIEGFIKDIERKQGRK